jgi:surface antigen
MLLILVISLLPAHQSVKAASACSCVGYVKAYLGIPSSEAVGNGKDMWKWLEAHGFQKLSGPQLGAVAVMQTTFPGADKTYGHVGIVVGINNGKITLRQNASGSSEFGCSNVGNVSWGTSVIGRTDIKFYAYSIYKIKTFITSSSTPSLNLDVSGGSKSAGGYVIGWTPHTGWNQQFYKIQYGQDYRIVNRNSALCLAPTSLNSGARIIQTTCGTGYDRWRISGNIIQNASNTGLVLDLAGGSLTPGNWIYLWRSQGSANQKWVFTQVSFQ